MGTNNQNHDESKENEENEENVDKRKRALSAVNENTESAVPALLKGHTLNSSNKPSRHPTFHRSQSSVNYGVHTLDELARRYSEISNVSGPRHSLLHRLRSHTLQTPSPDPPNMDISGISN